MNKRPLVVVGAAFGTLAAAFAIKKLLECPVVRDRMGMKPRSTPESDLVDQIVGDLNKVLPES